MKEGKNNNNVVNKIMSFPQVVGGNLPLTQSFMKKGKQPYFIKSAVDPRTLRAARHSGMILNWMGRFRSGFTLIELLVVVLIIGILAAVAVPQYQQAVKKSKIMPYVSFLRTMAQAQEVFFLANGRYALYSQDLAVEVPSTCTTSNDNVFNCGNLAWMEIYNATNKDILFAYCPNNTRSWGLCNAASHFELKYHLEADKTTPPGWKCTVKNNSSFGKFFCKTF